MTHVVVDALGARGDGIARHEGQTVFVPGAAPGDIAWLENGTVQRVEPGPNHAAARCPHFGPCGGCSLQHLRDKTYAQWLKTPIERALAQHDLTATIAAPFISPPETRRRAVLSGRWVQGKVHLGFSAQRSHVIEDIHECAVMAPALVKAISSVRGFLSTALPKKAKARVHFTLADNGLDVHLEGVPIDTLDVLEAVPELAKALGSAVRITGQDGPVSDILWQSETPVVALSGARVDLPVTPFLQATREGEAALINTCLAWADGANAAADLFSGMGTFSFALATQAKVDAFEASAASVKAAGAAKLPKGMHGVAVHHRDLFRRPLTPQELDAYDLALFDPPRAGAKAQSEQLAASAVARIIAVSCNPATFARDARLLIDGGYHLQTVQPVGQFLWSTHVELAALFTRQ